MSSSGFEVVMGELVGDCRFLLIDMLYSGHP